MDRDLGVREFSNRDVRYAACSRCPATMPQVHGRPLSSGMLARPVIRAPLPSRPGWLPSGFTVLDRSGHHLVVLDRMLAPVARIPAPVSDGWLCLSVSADGSLAAVADLDRTVVTAADGTIHWQCESVIKPQGLPQTPAVYIDRDGRLWLYVPDGDHIAVLDARTGEEIDRRGLSSCIGAGEFVAHPDGVHLGLSVAQGQDGTNSYWLHLDEGRIVVRELPGETLAGVAPSGAHYLDLPHLGTQLAIRRFADDHILASCAANDIPGFELHDRPALDEDAYGANGLASWLGPWATALTTAPAHRRRPRARRRLHRRLRQGRDHCTWS